MWIITQDGNYVNCDNICTIEDSECFRGLEIHAHTSDDEQVKLGFYNNYDSAKKALDEFYEALIRGDAVFRMTK